MVEDTFYKKIPEGETKETGRKVDVEVKKFISRGSWGSASEALIDMGGKSGDFVVKDYGSEEGAVRALKNYLVAKEAGLKVFTTFRINKDKKVVLMTTGHTEEWVCLGSNQEGRAGDLKFFDLPKLNSITNFDQFLEDYFEQAEIAARNNIYIHGDVPFFMVERKKDDAILDFVLGDYDNLTLKVNVEMLLDENRRGLLSPLIIFLAHNIKDSLRASEYITKAEEFVYDQNK